MFWCQNFNGLVIWISLPIILVVLPENFIEFIIYSIDVGVQYASIPASPAWTAIKSICGNRKVRPFNF
ncbi:MAG: hypothetical protein AW07_04458 [Candidatus Accumulibacter sp. SK-11]|nr:MAG: hypothetical protein AW07_04458 [Candidatus Accumulibacter sp. SK-11]